MPTSTAYSSNTITVAVYPICVEYKIDDDGPVRKGAITFISDDKVHNHQQMKAFEQRMFQILCEIGLEINSWQRWSDGCGAQFKSQYCNADLLNAKDSFKLQNASFLYFEANEGKNTSNTIGSIVKCAFLKGITKVDQGIGKVSDSLKFDFFIIEEFPFMERIEEKDCSSFCLPQKLCNECDAKDYYQVMDEESSDEEDGSEGFLDDEDHGQSDVDEDNDDEVDEENFSSYAPGDIVWGKYGKNYYPAKIVSHGELPERLQKGLFRLRKPESAIVKWYGEDNFSWVKIKDIDELAENKCDSARASLNEDIHQKYQLALADLRND